MILLKIVLFNWSEIRGKVHYPLRRNFHRDMDLPIQILKKFTLAQSPENGNSAEKKEPPK